MVSIDDHEFCISNVAEISSYKSIGIGCGIGTDELTQKALNKLLDTINKQSKKKKEINPLLVLDADALNILSENKNWLKKLPKGSILTPHPKEFERLFGKFENDFQRNEHQRKIAQKFGIYLVLKGANTSIACPNGNCYFNSTGNPGMATGGSGDVLTGILTGFLAQGYSAFQACILGIYLHGLAGDIASESTQQEALLSSDIINHMGQAFKAIRKN
jgi:NAD(P)H-hydrate epimerase